MKTKAQLVEEVVRLRQRLEELEISEEKSPWDREAFIAGIKDQVWQMEGTGDIKRVLTAMHQGLKRLGMPYHACDINLVEAAENPPTVSYYTLDGGGWREGEEEEGRETILRIWREGEVAYRSNLDVEDIHRERTYLESVFGRSIRSVLDIPFSAGTLAINSQHANAFSREDIAVLQETAEVLGDGFRRARDLQTLERRTGELEREIAERRQTEEALRESEERHRLLIERLPVGVAHTTPEGEFLYHNPYAQSLMGYSLEELAGMEVEEIYVNPEDREDLLRNLREKGEHNFEYLLRRKDGQEIWVQGTTRVIEDEEGRIIELQGFTLDITERKRAEELLRADLGLQRVRNQVLRMRFGDDWEEVVRCVHRELGELMAFDGLGINIVDRKGENFYSYEVTPDGLLAGDTIEFLPLALQHAVDEGKTVYRRNREEMTQFKDTIGMERNSAIDVPFIGGTIGASSVEEDAFGERDIRILEQFAGAVSDAYQRREDLRLLEQRSLELEVESAERRQIEEELVRSERLHAVGELSAGVSHNLNNMLVSILGPAQLLRRKSDDPEVLSEADEIISGARRARDLVHRLSLAVRGEAEKDMVPVPVQQVIRDAIQTARPRWKTEAEAQGVAIAIATDLEEVPDIRGTGTGLHEILLNLLLNAVDAMPEGGVITIGTGLADGGVLLTVRDTGIGMDKGTKQRIFEPFFTTKMDVGSGLGLATVHGAIERWGGADRGGERAGGGEPFCALAAGMERSWKWRAGSRLRRNRTETSRPTAYRGR